MTTLRIPARTDPAAYTMVVELDGQHYELGFRYNSRDGHWYMDVKHGDIVSVSGVKVVHSDDLLGQFNEFLIDDRLPAGTVRVFDVTEAGRDPGRDDFGDDVVLLYDEAS